MGSQKVLIFLGLLLALVLLISSEVAASRELAETTNTVNPSKEAEETDDAAVNDTKYNGDPSGYGGYPGGGNGGNGGGMGGYPGGGGGYCTYGCCGRSYNSRGCRCCTRAAQKPDADVRN